MKTWDSKSAAICTGLANLSAITKTSEGPAGMSIEIIASLFCRETGTKGKIKSRRGQCPQLCLIGSNLSTSSKRKQIVLGVSFLQLLHTDFQVQKVSQPAMKAKLLAPTKS